ncbi:MAG: type II toxin-antitoxin system VapC family toxin [Bacteroidota bacterium]|jgi:predicted nucleic acid-binding protein
MEKVFVDSDIVLDLLTGRQPHYKYSAELFSLADESIIEVFVSSLTFTNVNYILSRQVSSTQARKLLLKFKTLTTVLSVNDKIIELALSSDFQDFEDAVQYHTALENKIDILLTRNLKDFKKAEITILSAQQFLKSIE